MGFGTVIVILLDSFKYDSMMINFLGTLLPILEEHVPAKKIVTRRSRPIMDRKRRILWKRLAKLKSKIKCANNLHKIMKLLQDKSDLEQQLSEDYEAVNNMAEDEAVLRIK